MNVPLFLLVFVILLKKSALAIQCYRCIPEKVRDDSRPLCDGFDYSARFIVDCPHSTGCVKMTTQLLGVEESTESASRDCASQTMSGYQEKDASGKWRAVDKIHEVYEEGCQEDSNEYGKPTKAVHCFCRGNFCNSAHKSRTFTWGYQVLIFLWMVFNSI